MNTRYIILGLLAKQAMTGYDIKALFKGLSWLIDAPSYGSLYPTLHALLGENLVTVSVEPGKGKPPRKLYEITEAGSEALQTWLQSPELPEISVKAFARQLLLADALSREELEAYLVRRRAQVVAYLEHMRDGEREQEKEEHGQRGQGLVHDYGLTIARAELEWLETRIAELQACESGTWDTRAEAEIPEP